MNKVKFKLIIIYIFTFHFTLPAQYISHEAGEDPTAENQPSSPPPAKISHAEPLFIDLIRDLGARKGEKEWNVGLGITDNVQFDRYDTLIEYEFAPVNRLGLEIEFPFSLYYRSTDTGLGSNIPVSQLNSLKLAAQYTCFVSNRWKSSLAMGYLHEFELKPIRALNRVPTLKGHLYSPFLVAAKRWGHGLHSLIYTGPLIENELVNQQLIFGWQTNISGHFMLPGTRNFVGLEVNQRKMDNQQQWILRPQIRLGLADNLLVGIVAGIPTRRQTERLSSFLRLIYEPGHRHKAPQQPI
jgi:hypothetical protein